MNLQEYRDELKLKLTGELLDLELADSTLDAIINSAMREIQRYYCSTRLLTVPYSPVIDMSEYNVNSVSRVYRTNSTTSNDSGYTGMSDPMYLSRWQMFTGGYGMNVSEWVENYGAWTVMQQLRNTTSTDLNNIYDKYSEKLYINVADNIPSKVTIEYVPKLQNVTEIVSDYWIDMLMRFAVAIAKVTLGRVRNRYTNTNAQWTQDGATLLEEGNNELEQLREYVQTNTQLCYPID